MGEWRGLSVERGLFGECCVVRKRGREGRVCCAGRRSCGIEIAWAQH